MELTEQQLKEIISKASRTVVGILCKRIEILEEEERKRQCLDPSAKILTPRIYKALVKEIVHEQFRNLRTILEILTIPTVIFRRRESK